MPMSCELSMVFFLNWFEISWFRDVMFSGFMVFMMITLILQTPTHGIGHNKNVVKWKDSIAWKAHIYT